MLMFADLRLKAIRTLTEGVYRDNKQSPFGLKLIQITIPVKIPKIILLHILKFIQCQMSLNIECNILEHV